MATTTPAPRATNRAAHQAARKALSTISPMMAWNAFAEAEGFDATDPATADAYKDFRRMFLVAIAHDLDNLA
jgi:hypothetical protein